MPDSRKKNIIRFLLLLLIAIGAAGYYFYNKGPVNINNATAQHTSAATLYSDFIADPVAAQKKYSGKILSVSGIVAQASMNNNGETIVLLTTSTGSSFINCTLQEKNIQQISKGQSIQIKGACSGLGEGDTELGIQPDIYLERCIIIEP